MTRLPALRQKDRGVITQITHHCDFDCPCRLPYQPFLTVPSTPPPGYMVKLTAAVRSAPRLPPPDIRHDPEPPV